MSSGSFNQVYVRCPFYVTDDGRSWIKCEGLTESSKVSQAFVDKSEYTDWMKTYCNKSYKYCEIYNMIMQAKYIDD